MIGKVATGARDMVSPEGVGSILVVVAVLVGLYYAGFGLQRLASYIPRPGTSTTG
jgi:hypothetical protein